jgi:sigma-B regulation protein RsbU (phosphoserine phosphatase)
VSARDSVPSRIMENLNNIIIGFSDTNMFVTLFIGVLDLPTGTLHYCNAGHDIPLLVGAGVGKLPCDSNIPVGFMPQWKYSLQEARIFTGTTIFLYTDGLTEAEDINHAQFKNKRVIEVAEKALSLQQHEPRQLIDMMTDAVHQFVGDAEQSDDLTMMAIQYIRQERDVKFSKRIVLTNDIKQLTQLTAFVQEVCEQLGFNENLTKKMNLAIEEAVTNVIFYAYPRGIKGDISIEAVSNDVRLKFTIIDSGSPFDPTMKGEADITSSLEDRPIGGLGIHLMRKIMDSINYERIDGHNVLTLRKKLNT